MSKSKYELAKQQFDYQDGLDMLRPLGISSPQIDPTEHGQSPHIAFISLTGSIIRQGSDTEKRAVDEVLRTGKITEPPVRPRKRNDQGCTPQQNKGEYLRNTTRDNQLDTLDIARYTMILKERGDKVGAAPLYTEQTLTLVPPNFKVTVEFENKSFEGFGSTKKQAKHEASKQACDYLSLDTY